MLAEKQICKHQGVKSDLTICPDLENTAPFTKVNCQQNWVIRLFPNTPNARKGPQFISYQNKTCKYVHSIHPPDTPCSSKASLISTCIHHCYGENSTF